MRYFSWNPCTLYVKDYEMDLLEFIFDILSDIRIWVGIGLGLLLALIAWRFLPESVDRVLLGAWFVGLGFVGGLIFAKAEK